MTYDLRKLRLAGFIHRIEHNRYVLHNRLLRPLMAADQPQAPPGLRHALETLNQHVDDYISRARL